MGWVVNAATWPVYLRGKRPSTYCTGGWVGPQGWSRRVRKILPLQGFNPQTVQPVTSLLYRVRYPSPLTVSTNK